MNDELLAAYKKIEALTKEVAALRIVIEDAYDCLNYSDHDDKGILKELDKILDVCVDVSEIKTCPECAGTGRNGQGEMCSVCY